MVGYVLFNKAALIDDLRETPKAIIPISTPKGIERPPVTTDKVE
jgi:hypothetical protein